MYYSFEALVSNQFHGRNFTCSQFIPSYPTLTGDSFICSVVGSVAGQTYVSGDAYIQAQYEYSYAHEWRNLGIMIGFWIFFLVLYLLASELNSATSSKAEFLVFRRGHVPPHLRNIDKNQGNSESIETVLVHKDAELDKDASSIPAQHDIFTWRNVCYDIPVKGGQRRLLDNVSGWVKPGTLTALMGVSGAGKTTLLDTLAKRVSIGIVTGDMFVNGKPLDSSFQRKTGYVQQQDLHLSTTTVREALRFSAMLRQPKSVSKAEKHKYVEEIIEILNMEDFADAIVGTPGEGLNVEQRKLLTIGVELAAKPALLLFLDEPTSGLDSQSSWAICAFLRKLADHGQAVLSTIHQPSAMLFQQFDRLLFLAKGGRTVYFGDIGEQSRTLLDYLESQGAEKCESSRNVTIRPSTLILKSSQLTLVSLPNICLRLLEQAPLGRSRRTGLWSGIIANKRKMSRKSLIESIRREAQVHSLEMIPCNTQNMQCRFDTSCGMSRIGFSSSIGVNLFMCGRRSCSVLHRLSLLASVSSCLTTPCKASRTPYTVLSC